MRYYEHYSRKAKWSYRVAVLSLIVFGTAFVWHRFFSLPTPLALKLFGISVVASIVSLMLGSAALISIWNEGHLGAARASLASFLSLIVLAVPLWSLPSLLTLPRIYDITTDAVTPPAFDRVGRIRQGQANPVRYEASFAAVQAAAYPDIQPLEVQKPVADVYSAVREAVKTLNWKVVDEQAPEQTRTGHIEAVDRTLLFGFTDDVVLRVTGSAKNARVDIRSSSRFGQHDLGRNAERIRRFMAEVKGRLAQMDEGERLEQEVATRQQVEEKAARQRPQSRDNARQRRAIDDGRAGGLDRDSWPRWAPN